MTTSETKVPDSFLTRTVNISMTLEQFGWIESLLPAPDEDYRLWEARLYQAVAQIVGDCLIYDEKAKPDLVEMLEEFGESLHAAVKDL
jgi:hypothetical protein